MKRLYKCDKIHRKKLHVPYNIVKTTPSLFRAYPGQRISGRVIMMNIYWYLITGGKYHVWVAMEKRKVIHASYVMPGCLKFRFLADGEYEIGPCWIDENYRGQGIYPAVLSEIISNDGTYYLIVDENNVSSIKGVVKVGCEVLPGTIEKNGVKSYFYNKEIK